MINILEGNDRQAYCGLQHDTLVAAQEELTRCLQRLGPVAIAVSGGVDSLTLATLANRVLPPDACSMFHAVSPAVPLEATERVRALAPDGTSPFSMRASLRKFRRRRGLPQALNPWCAANTRLAAIGSKPQTPAAISVPGTIRRA